MARPRKICAEILQKPEEGFVMGMTDREACIYAAISTSTLYNYCNDKPEFLERKEQLKDGVKMRAKINIAKKIENGAMDVRKIYDAMSEEELMELVKKYEKSTILSAGRNCQNGGFESWGYIKAGHGQGDGI